MLSMDTSFLLPYLLSLLLVPLSLYLAVSLRKGSGDAKTLPPGSTSWVAENLALNLFGYQKFVRDRMQKHSGAEVFKTSLLGEKTAVFCGAQANKFLFSNDNKLMTAWHPPSMRKALLPEFVGSNKPSAIFHGFGDIIKPEALKKYIPAMDAAARRLLTTGWVPNSVVKVLPYFEKYSLELSFSLLANVADPGLAERLVEPFTVLGKGVSTFPIDFPGTALNRAVEAGRLLRGEVMGVVKGRRKELSTTTREIEGEGSDILTKMLLVCDEEDDAKVATLVVSMAVASFEAIAYVLAAVVTFLTDLPEIYEEVLREQMEIADSKGHDKALTWEHLEKMKYTWNVVRESMRLIPPAPGAFRVVLADFTYAGFTIPKGWKTFWTPHSTHMNPDYFPDPDKFNPSRFEGSGPAPYTYIPFGGGPKMCPGRDYARVAILVFIHNVVTRFRLEKVVPNEKIVFHSRPTVAQGLPIYLHPHN